MSKLLPNKKAQKQEQDLHDVFFKMQQWNDGIENILPQWLIIDTFSSKYISFVLYFILFYFIVILEK